MICQLIWIETLRLSLQSSSSIWSRDGSDSARVEMCGDEIALKPILVRFLVSTSIHSSLIGEVRTRDLSLAQPHWPLSSWDEKVVESFYITKGYMSSDVNHSFVFGKSNKNFGWSIVSCSKYNHRTSLAVATGSQDQKTTSWQSWSVLWVEQKVFLIVETLLPQLAW